MSSDRIIECVPNFSEGRDDACIDKIVQVMNAVDGALVLDTDPGRGTNRTEVTVVGSPEAMMEAAFQGIQLAGELIDMTCDIAASNNAMICANTDTDESTTWSLTRTAR